MGRAMGEVMGEHTRPGALVVQNNGSGPRRVGDWLREEGVELDVVPAHTGAPLPRRLDHHAIIVLGGGYLPDADDRAPWLATTRSLVAQALDEGRPVLGICLGGQLLAHVGGGTVEGNVGEPECGSTPVHWRPEAAEDPLFHDVPEVVPAMEHHVDAITRLPEGASWLAESDRCAHQAFRLGATAWGVQFHPELAPDRIRQWNVDQLRRQGFDPDAVYAQAVADEAVSTPVWERVIRRFAGTVRESAPPAGR